MNNQVMTMIVEYRLAIMIGVLALLILLSKIKRRGNKLLHILTVALALSIVYEVIMHEPVTRLPALINQTLNQPNSASESANPHYYKKDRYNLSEDK